MAVRVRVVAPQAARHAIQSFWIVVWEDEASHVVVTADAEHVARLSVRDARHAASRQYFRRHAKAREHLQVFCGKISRHRAPPCSDFDPPAAERRVCRASPERQSCDIKPCARSLSTLGCLGASIWPSRGLWGLIESTAQLRLALTVRPSWLPPF